MSKKEGMVLFLFVLVSILSCTIYAEDVESEVMDSGFNDFTAYYSSSKLNLCACSLYTDEIDMYNSGNLPSLYNIYAEGDAQNWVSIAPNYFDLQPGEAEEVKMYINVPCDEQGDSDLKIIMEEGSGKKKEINQEINVNRCSDIGVAAAYNKVENCPCTINPFKFMITNTGSYTDTFYLYLEDVNPNYYAITHSQLTLEPGESEEVFLYIKLPCGEYGEKSFDFSVYGSKSKMKALLPVYLDIKQSCYNYGIALSDFTLLTQQNQSVKFSEHVDYSFEMCEYNSGVMLTKLENFADIANTYTLFVEDGEDISWIDINENSIYLPPGEDYTTAIFFNPGEDTEGLYNLAFKVESDRGDLLSVIPFDLDVVDCVEEAEQEKKSSLLWYLLLLLLLLFVLGIIAFLVYLLFFKEKDEDDAAVPLPEEKPKPVKKDRLVIEKRKAEKKSEPGKFKWLWLLLPLLLLLLLLLGTLSYCTFVPSDGVNETEEVVSDPVYGEIPQEILDLQDDIEKLEEEIAAVEDQIDEVEDEIIASATDADKVAELEAELIGLELQRDLLNMSLEDKEEQLEELLEQYGLTEEDLEVVEEDEEEEKSSIFSGLFGKLKSLLFWFILIPLLLYLLLGLLIIFLVWYFSRDKKEKKEKEKFKVEKVKKEKTVKKGRSIWGWLLPLLLLLLLVGVLFLGFLFLPQCSYFSKEGVNETEEVVDELMSEEEFEELLNELDELDEMINDREGELEELQEELILISEENEFSDLLEEEIEKLGEEIDDLRDRRDELEARVYDHENRIIQLEEDIDGLEEEVARLLSVIESMITAEDEEQEEIVEEEVEEADEGTEVMEEEEEFIDVILEEVESDGRIDLPEVTVLVIDTSISAKIMENGRTRFDRVIESVYNYLDRYDEGVFTVIIIGRNPLVLEREVDREAVEYVVDRLIPFGEESSIGASLRRAGDLLGERDGRIVVISDFVTTDGSDLEYEKDLLENEGKTVIFNDISEGFQEEVEVFEPEVIEEEIEEVIVEEQKLAVIMDKNTVYELDLGEHFIDADNDELIFSVQEPDNVKIEIEGNIAQFIPEEDWYGTTSAVFTADDGKGGVEEGQVVIFVNDKAEEVLGPQEIVAEIVEEVNGDEEEMLVDAVEEVQELPEIVYVEDEKKGYNWFKIFGYVAAALAVWLLLIYVVVAARK